MYAYLPNIFADLAVILYYTLILLLFSRFPLRVSILAFTVVAWLFLPNMQYHFAGILVHYKTDIIASGILLGILIRKPDAFSGFQFHWIDLPVVAYLLSPMLSSLNNGLGINDGVQASFEYVWVFILPYLIGRTLFARLEDMNLLALVAFMGSLLVLPLFLLELRISPQLHTWIYGWYPSDFAQTLRSGGWRPSVFMRHGLELAIWNSFALFCGWQLFLNKTVVGKIPLLNIPILAALIFFTGCFFNEHSVGAVFLFLGAMAGVEFCYRTRNVLPILAISLLCGIFIYLRAVGIWDGKNISEWIIDVLHSPERAQSIAFRVFNENLIAEHTREQIFFGFSRTYFLHIPNLRIIPVPDSKWIAEFGTNGAWGVTSYFTSLFLAPTLFLISIPTAKLRDPKYGGAVAVAVFLFMIGLDGLLNNMGNPLVPLGCGALASIYLGRKASATGTLGTKVL